MSANGKPPLGYRWRSSSGFILSCMAVALFSGNFLYSYIVPILPDMLETRLHVPKSQTQATTSLVLSAHALACLIAGPLTGYLADRAPSRRFSLIASLGVEMIGTVIIMVARTVPVLVLGRIIEGLGGNCIWLVGLATVAETVGPNHTGAVMTTISSFYASGLILGPVISGLLLSTVGYYATWSVALLVLGFDMMMRLVMIGKKHEEQTNLAEGPCNNNDPVEGEAENARASSESTADETSSLIRSSQNDRSNYGSQPDSNSVSQEPDMAVDSPGHQSVYKAMLANPCALASLAGRSAMAVIMVSFDTTLPLHSKDEFGWNSARVSLMFLLLQLPAIFLAPFSGMLKDKFGTKFPTAAGFFAISIFIWLMGTPGKDGLPFAGVGGRGQAIFMTAIVGVGTARTLISGCGTIELTNVMKQLEAEQPGRFGPGGGLSTAYSLNNIAWTSGMLIGPIVSGFLVRRVGYYWMNSSLAIMCIVSGFGALAYLHKK
ncbi:hypothetical protein N7467_012223 [Penicillium canescens]|nr:hypothetical protein N7467_012223 [Penicillium canescens]